MNKRRYAWLVALGWAIAGTSLSAQVAETPPVDDQAAAEIRQKAAAYTESFNAHDAAAVAAHFAEDADYINDAGKRTVGREAIAKEHEAFFANNPQATMHLTIDAIRLLGDTAIEDGRAMIGPFPEGAPAYSKYTVIHVKRNGQWLMASVRDSHVDLPLDDRHLSDFDWLVGTWHAERDSISLDVKCRWMAGHRFLIRTFNLRDGEEVTQAGMQVIGWEPLTQHISSWLFDSTGGYAVGTWTPSESGWTIESAGVTRDGQLTRATNSFRRVDDNSLAWKSTDRTIGDTAIPDLEEVVVTRTQE